MKQAGIICSELFSKYNTDLRKDVAEIGLSIIQAKVLVLAGIFDRDELSQKDMARICGTDTPAMSRTIDKLEEAGYIIRIRNNEDSRSFNIKLSETGAVKCAQVEDKFDNVFDSRLSKLNYDEKNQFIILLNKVIGESEVFERIDSKIKAAKG